VEKIKRVKSFNKAELFTVMQIKAAEAVELGNSFKSLSAEQLNWKPNKKKAGALVNVWSI
jgi:hypothetical protein